MRCNIGHDCLPREGLELINRLNRAGYEAWFVGGCVRDLLLGIQPHDWDICTNALPEETEACLPEYRIHETGIKHGTVLVMAGEQGYEITTYRTESAYTDHRHPDAVQFVRELTQDLARRDFTINAMAYHSRFGLVDRFGGKADLEQGVIRAVGRPEERFREDALRILRALRFAARFGFSIEPETAKAVHEQKEVLRYIARERIFSELKGFLCSPGAAPLLLEFSDVFGTILPELAPAVGFAQNTPHHDADVWTHTVRVVEGVPEEDAALRLAALFHDVAKPECCTLGADGYCHFYGHNRRGAELADEALRRLKCDNETRTKAVELVSLHDAALPEDLPAVRRFLSRRSVETARMLLTLRRADVLGQSSYHREEKLEQLARFERLVDEAVREGPCWSLDQLAIKGRDLMEHGIAPGPEIGRKLKLALKAVMEGRVKNDLESLLNYLYRQGEIKR